MYMATIVLSGVRAARSPIPKFAFILISVFAISVLDLSAQDRTVEPSSIRVDRFVVKDGKTATKILRSLAEKYRLVIGVHGSGNFRDLEMPAGIDVDIKSGTLADVFDAVADIHRHKLSSHQTIGSVTDQQFEWHQESDGAIHFALLGAPISLMDVTVHSFDYENPQWPEITDRLRAVPEIDSWLRTHNCSMPGQIIHLGGRPPSAWKKFAIHARDIPVSSILDEIAVESGTYYWRAAEIMNPNSCFVNIQWWL